MLPIRLELRNFLAYRAPEPLSFKELELACLSGPNGAGKSSLLDAITWALWGRARAGSDDDLIHMGQEEMYVIFDFRQDQAVYRVVRKRSKRGRGQSTLDLYAWDEANQQFHANNGSSIRETQHQINQLLRLGYDTFVTSAFLQQGKADAFSVKTPRERKEVLGDILGLSNWDRHEAQVKETLKKIETELSVINGRIVEIDQEEVREPALQRELATAAQHADEARAAREAADERLAEVAGAPAQMQNANAQLVAAQRRVRHAEHDLKALASELEQQQRRWAAYQQTIANRQAIEEGYERLQQARQVDYDLGDKLAQRAEADKRLHELERQLDAARAELEHQAGLYQDRIGETDRIEAQGDPVKVELAEVQLEIDRLQARANERDHIHEEKKMLSEEIGALKTRNEALRREMDDIKDRLTLIESADGAVCPFCRQPLDERHRDQLANEYRAEGRARGDTFRANKTRLEAIATTLTAYAETLAEIEADLNQFDVLKARQGALRERIEAVEKATQRRDAARTALEEVQRMLDEGDFSPELRAQIDQLQEEIDGLGYDKDIHSEAREALTTLRAFETQKRELEMAIEALPDVEARIQGLQERTERCSDELAEVSEEVAHLQQAITELTALVQEARRRQEEVNRLRTVERSATEKLISVQQQLAAIEAARQRKRVLQERRQQLGEDEALYQQLREAFGKNGVQAMIIEAAIPELEEATNKLLARMTDGRMHVRFDTQREKKTGGVMETLDFLVSDELGTRRYETFSGGEGFRVNFALRIALSQFLARRAGARLQTLVIDEGFGSQDDVGRERLVEAINAIRHDFDLILIVTHLEELRDHFPVRIEVRKTPDGSVISVL